MTLYRQPKTYTVARTALRRFNPVLMTPWGTRALRAPRCALGAYGVAPDGSTPYRARAVTPLPPPSSSSWTTTHLSQSTTGSFCLFAATFAVSAALLLSFDFSSALLLSFDFSSLTCQPWWARGTTSSSPQRLQRARQCLYPSASAP